VSVIAQFVNVPANMQKNKQSDLRLCCLKCNMSSCPMTVNDCTVNQNGACIINMLLPRDAAILVQVLESGRCGSTMTIPAHKY
jgi:hypothetical protein